VCVCVCLRVIACDCVCLCVSARAHARALARTAQTLGDFDDAFIAPVYGFRDKYDYYTQVCKDTVVKTQ